MWLGKFLVMLLRGKMTIGELEKHELILYVDKWYLTIIKNDSVK